MDNMERKIIAAGAASGPRVTPDDVEDAISQENYFTAWDGAEAGPNHVSHRPDPALKLLTFCVLVLKNGFTVTGESACASPENFNAAIGREIARADAVRKVWPLLGFRLRDQLAGGKPI